MNSKRMILSPVAAVILCGLLGCRAEAQQSTKVVVPDSSWSCGMPEGIPNPENGDPIFQVDLKLDRVAEIGKTPYGNRRIAVAGEGTVTGPKLSASVMTGALDFELTLSNGTIEIEQILVLKTGDGKYIYVRNAGVGADAKDVRIVMDFEAPNESDYAWLNTGKYVARRQLNAAAKTLTLHVYDVSAVALRTGTADVIKISKPAGSPSQPWDARTKAPAEMQGEVLIRENVTLSPSQRVGASKRGNRNIIPITGGELSGRITGKVLAGGADYQNLTPPATIDARYLWQASDGEIIIVRNAGPFGALVPTFEARVDGPYAFLNTGLFLSSNPGVGQGGVGIAMYDSKN